MNIAGVIAQDWGRRMDALMAVLVIQNRYYDDCWQAEQRAMMAKRVLWVYFMGLP